VRLEHLSQALGEGSIIGGEENGEPGRVRRGPRSDERGGGVLDAQEEPRGLMWNCVPLGMAQTKQVVLVGRRA
jgi:hypothetical protein